MYRTVKRGLDILFSLILLLFLGAPLLLVMLCISLESEGAPIFAQTRIGRKGKPFTIYKLRTMRKEAPKSVATSRLDGATNYITPLGAFLRRFSLDELPQLYNILRGDMSFVGPRPLVPEEVSVHEERKAKGVYAVCPGMTGWAQINGRDQVHEGMKADLDAYYAQNICFGLDARIAVKTVGYVLSSRGVQEGAQEAEREEESSDA